MSLDTAVIYGSARRERQGIRAAKFIVRQLASRRHRVDLVDTLEYELPMLDLMYKEYAADEAPPMMARAAEILGRADGFVIVSGEYNHSIPAALKNLLDHFQAEYLFKPSALVTYSAGPFGGVRALVNLRGIMAELGASAIPSALPISRVQSAFDRDGNALDDAYDRRIRKFLDEYEWYARALRAARLDATCGGDAPMQQTLCRCTSAG